MRASGGGRKGLTETDPELLYDLARLVADESRGDPESPLRWTAKSVRHLARAVREQGREIHFTSAAKLLRALGYSMQANGKNKERAPHPDRDAQFRHINATAKAALGGEQPAISVDTPARRRHLRALHQISDHELATVNLTRDKFHGEWSYRIAGINRHGERNERVRH
ncbi:MAG: hypothetical protein LC790_03095 [Actinobacteria bacterium]|nr:hypothetical protein [Actinomycetota bacterium]